MQNFDKKSSTLCIAPIITILLIPSLFLLGIVLAYLNLISLKVELHSLLIISFIFIVFMFFVKHNANYAVCFMRKSFIRMEQDLQSALRSNALSIMGKTKSTLNIKDFMSEYYRDIRNDNFARVAPSIFPMLGILGTFIAIAISMPDFTAKDTSTLDREISLLLSGVGTAFYASIYGILLSLVWTYFEKRGVAKVDRQIFELERLYNDHIWKKSELIKHEHTQSELKDQQIVQTLKETFNMDFVKELNDEYIKNFTTIVNDTTNSFNQLTIHMRDISSELQSTIKSIEDRRESISAVNIMEENISEFNKSAKNLEKRMKHFDDSVDHTFDKIDEELAKSVEKLAKFTQLLSTVKDREN